MGYSANNAVPYFTDPINFDNCSFRCQFCEQLIFLSFIAQLPVYKVIMAPCTKVNLHGLILLPSADDFSFQIMSLYFLIYEMRIHVLSWFNGLCPNKKKTN